MAYAGKIVLHLRSTNRHGLDDLVEEFIRDGVRYVGVVGADCSFVEDVIDEICVGPCDGSREPYSLLTASHAGESVEEAVEFAKTMINGEYDGHPFGDSVQIVAIG